MSFTIDVEPRCITSSEVREFCELFFAGGSDVHIDVRIVDSPGPKAIRGVCRPAGPRRYEIEVYYATISTSIDRSSATVFGGNVTKTHDKRLACMFVLAHELRHAYQGELHATNEKFFRKRGYFGRPCEVDARRHVDESYESVCAFAGVEPDPHIRSRVRAHSDSDDGSLYELVDTLLEGLDDDPRLSSEDVRHELSCIGSNNPISYAVVQALLEEGGATVV